MHKRKYKTIYITFSVQLEKDLDNGKAITYKLKFIDSFRFMSISISSLADNYLKGFITKTLENVGLALRFANTYEFCNKVIS